MHIRNFPEELHKQLRVRAAELGLTLREYVIEVLSGTPAQKKVMAEYTDYKGTTEIVEEKKQAHRLVLRSVAGLEEKINTEPCPSVESWQELKERPNRKRLLDDTVIAGEPVPGTGFAPPRAGMFERPAVVAGKTCRHGKEKGWNCGLCGGMARVEE